MTSRRIQDALQVSPAYWVLGLLSLAAAPHALRLPWWVGLLALLALGWRAAAPARLRRARATALFNAVLLLCALGGIYLSVPTWVSGDGITSFLIVVLSLKGAEAKARREYLLVCFGAVILAGVGALYSDSLLSFLHLFSVVLLLLAVMARLEVPAQTPVSLGPSLGPCLGTAGKTLAFAFPCAVLLFLTFPRIPGPLWDLGVAFGLPINVFVEKQDRGMGFDLKLAPGEIMRLSTSNQTVLVAEFKDPIPYKSELYWRGPVFWDFLDGAWQLGDGWERRGPLLRRAVKTRDKFDRLVGHKARPIRYEVRVQPHGRRWLYGLDLPSRSAPEAFISGDFQLLSIRKVNAETGYDMVSYLDYATYPELPPADRDRASVFPAGTSPRLKAYGQALRRDHGRDEDILQAVLARLAGGDYRYDERHVLPQGAARYDTFFFDAKQGGAEALASSFVLLMRAAGLPARLVTGYRGGTIIALTDFIVVKQSNAHAWAEVWLAERGGWVRVDPKDFVSPPGRSAARSGPAPAARPQPQPDDAGPAQRREEAASQDALRPDTPRRGAAQTPLGTSLRDLFGKAETWAETWIVAYDPERQIAFFRALGIGATNWLTMLLVAGAAVCLIVVAWGLTRQVRSRVRKDPVLLAYGRFTRALGTLGLPRAANECPRAYGRRVIESKPEIAAWVEDIIGRYIELRYGGRSDTQALRDFDRQVRRFSAMV